jgi:hypothetical protein
MLDCEEIRVRAAIAKVMADNDNLWKPTDVERIWIEPQGRWLSPQLFKSAVYGSWELNYNKVAITVDIDD